MATISITEDVKEALLRVASELQLKLGRKVDLDEAIRYLLSGSLERRKFLSTILDSKESPRMFSIVGETWNPIYGCLHNCQYCWARKLARDRLRNSRKYSNGFQPNLDERELKREFKPGGVVFVSDMGDIFSPGVEDEWIERVIEHVSRFPQTYFLFLTKNPFRYHEFSFPSNSILGATIETNRDMKEVSRAPPPSERYEAMRKLEWPLKFIAVEPILDFDPEILAKWIKEIDPVMVYIGYDNYNNKLLEPPIRKTERLIEAVKAEGIIVFRKTIRPAWNEDLYL